MTRISIVVAAFLTLNAVPGFAAWRESDDATSTAALSVASDPSGATVYVDGRPTGQTPLSVRLPPGDRRVRVVKDGYLENSRVVYVSAARRVNLQVTLTRGSTAAATAAGIGGGGPKKWIWIAAAGGGAAATGLYVARRNAPPVGGSVTVSPTGVGMAGVTTFSFDTSASDADGDELTYTWDFGDGGTATGQAPTHVYTTTGTFNILLRVTDGKTEPVSATGVSVTVAPSVAGTWTGVNTLSFFPCGITVMAAQGGSTLTGSFRFTPGTVGCSAAPAISVASGAVSPLTHPATVTWTSDSFSFAFLPGPLVIANLSVRFTGMTNVGGNSMTGTFQTLQGGAVVVSSALTLTK